MTIGEFLVTINASYLMALAVLVALVVEAIKQTDWVPKVYLSLVASGIGFLSGIVIGLLYQEPLAITSFNGLLVGLLAAGGFDALKALWRLPEELN